MKTSRPQVLAHCEKESGASQRVVPKGEEKTHPSGEVRKSCGERWRLLVRVETRGANLTVHLDGGEGESSDEGGSVANDWRALLQHAVASGVVGDVDDEGEVLGAKEGRDSGLDEVEPLLEPRRSGLKAREPVDLPGKERRQSWYNRTSSETETHFSRRECT